jgi:hypothetical protein
MDAIDQACPSLDGGQPQDCPDPQDDGPCDASTSACPPVDRSNWMVAQLPEGLGLVDSATGEVLEAESKVTYCGASKVLRDQEYATALAEGYAGQAINLTYVDGQVALYTGSGERISAGPGEGIPFRLAAMAAMEGNTACLALGISRKGRLFGVSSTGWLGHHKFSQALQQRRSQCSRKILRGALDLLQYRLRRLDYDQTWSARGGGRIRPTSLVLTGPTLDPEIVPQLCEAGEESRTLGAFELFRKREVFKDHVIGGCRGYEITRPFVDGIILFHPHIHSLLWAQFIPQRRLAVHWWQCLRTATLKEYGFDIDGLYRDPETHKMAVTACVYIQQVRPRIERKQLEHDEYGHPNLLTLEGAILENLKYTTKPQDVAAYIPGPHGEKERVGLPTQHLVSEALRRSPRVFATLGAAREGWDPPHWCLSIDELLGDTTTISIPHLLATQALRSDSPCSIYNSAINDGSSDNPEGTSTANQPRPKNPSLRNLMMTLDLDEWLQVLWERAHRSMDYSRKRLADKGYLIHELRP